MTILRHAQFLGVPAKDPLGVSNSHPCSYSFIKGSNVTDDMRLACEMAYPNPQHRLCLNIK
jgi:hypothetical protein